MQPPTPLIDLTLYPTAKPNQPTQRQNAVPVAVLLDIVLLDVVLLDVVLLDVVLMDVVPLNVVLVVPLVLVELLVAEDTVLLDVVTDVAVAVLLDVVTEVAVEEVVVALGGHGVGACCGSLKLMAKSAKLVPS